MHQFSMLYFSSMIEDRELWSGWAKALREQGLHEPVAWLIKAGRPAAILLSQVIILAQPIFSSTTSNQKLDLLSRLLEDGDQLEEFTRALQDNGREA
jgi:hypothetical protein